MTLGGGRLPDRPLLDDGGGRWRGRRGRLHHGGHDQPSLDLHRERLGVRRLRTRLGGHDPHAQGQMLQGCEAEDTGVDVPARRWNQD
jgi:hypothetical protein